MHFFVKINKIGKALKDQQRKKKIYIVNISKETNITTDSKDIKSIIIVHTTF